MSRGGAETAEMGDWRGALAVWMSPLSASEAA